MSRRLRLGMLMSAAALVALLLVVLILQVAANPRFRIRWNWSGAGSGALSGRSAAALAALPEHSRATFFLLPEEARLQWNRSSVYPQAFGLLRTTAEEIRIKSHGQVEVEVLDRWSAPVDLEAAIKRLGRRPSETLVLEASGRRQVLRFDELFQVAEAQGGMPAHLRGQRIDEALGDAALRLGQDSSPKIAVLRSYLPASAQDPVALRPLEHLLESEGYRPETVEAVPAPEADFALLLIPGQIQSLNGTDSAAVEEWLRARKPLLLALDFTTPEPVIAAWNQRLTDRGIGFGLGLACAPWRGGLGTSACANRLELPPERLSPSHPVTAALRAAHRSVELGATRPLVLFPNSGSYLREQLAWMDRKAWVETEAVPDFRPGPGEQRGPFPVLLAAQALQGDSALGRTLLSGSVAPFFDRLLRERDLLAAAVRWLVGDDQDRTGLMDLRSLPYRPTQEQHARLANLALLALPGCTLLLAFLIYWRRRR